MKRNTLMLALLMHIHAEHELEAFSPQMNESQTTASKNEIDDSVEFASAVKTQQQINKGKSKKRTVPYRPWSVASDLRSEIFTDTTHFILLKHW